jgi:hypothetical protein
MINKLFIKKNFHMVLLHILMKHFICSKLFELYMMVYFVNFYKIKRAQENVTIIYFFQYNS